MKNIMMAILKLIGKAKVADLDNDGKIESINEEILGLFSQFRIMSEQLDNANSELSNIIEDEDKKQVEERERLEALLAEHERKMQESEYRAKKAQANIEKNNHIKSKVDEFVI